MAENRHRDLPARRRARGDVVDVEGAPIEAVKLPDHAGDAFDAFNASGLEDDYRRLLLTSVCCVFDNDVLVAEVEVRGDTGGLNTLRRQRMLAYAMVTLMAAVKEPTPDNITYLERRWSALVASAKKGYPQGLGEALGLEVGTRLIDQAAIIKRLTERYVDPRRVVTSLLEEVSGLPASSVALRTQVAMIYAYHGMAMIRLTRDFVNNPVQLPFCVISVAREALAFREAYRAVTEGVAPEVVPFLFTLRGDLPRLHQSLFPNLTAVVRAAAVKRGLLNANFASKRHAGMTLDAEDIDLLTDIGEGKSGTINRECVHLLRQIGLQDAQIERMAAAYADAFNEEPRRKARRL
ncbi:TPA_asm: hypothetical protein [Macroli virus]|nr:TPA_asm: hypothetical protein [Macroli virus]